MMTRSFFNVERRFDMARRKDDITVVGYLILEDGRIIPWDERTTEQDRRFRENATKRLTQVMSDYYTQHPEEYAKLESLE